MLPQLVDQGLPGGGEFLVCDLGDQRRAAQIVALLVYHGFLPMGGMGMLLPKIHKARCILPPAKVHVGRKTRRRAKGFRMTVDTAWAVVVANIQEHTFTHHKGDCWLSDELATVYEAVQQLPEAERRNVSFHSVEIWHCESGNLAAGEIGYTCGSCYSSCTGFCLKDEYPGAGSAQLGALGRWLARCGYQLWDLGMELDYKIALGGVMVSRKEWADRVRQTRSDAVARLRPPAEDAESDVFSLLGGLEGEGLVHEGGSSGSRAPVAQPVVPAPSADAKSNSTTREDKGGEPLSTPSKKSKKKANLVASGAAQECLGSCEPAEVLVTGAGSAVVNGRYRLQRGARKGGRAVYTHAECSRYKVQYSTQAEVWMIDDTRGSAPYKAEGSNDFPTVPVGRLWAIYQGGLAPPPSLEASSGLCTNDGKHGDGSSSSMAL